MTPCETCAKLALTGSKHCLTCWKSWWETVVRRSEIQVIAAARKREEERAT